MLVEDGIAADARIEDAEVKHAFQDHEQEGDAQNRRGEHLHPSRGIERPWEKRHAHPVHALARMRWMVVMKLSPVRMEEKPMTKAPSTAMVTLVPVVTL